MTEPSSQDDADRGSEAEKPATGDRAARWSRTRGSDANGLGSRTQRGTDLARLSAATGAGYVGARLRGLRDADAEQAFHAASAERMGEVLGQMKGAAMKLGQIASFIDLDLPPEIAEAYQDVLAQLRDQAPPADPDAIARVVTEEYGAPPERVFDEWQHEPLAVASIGQVHRARLPDGTAVVAKVQYPGVAEAIEADLANAESLRPLVRIVSPNLQVGPLLEEMRDRLVDELDYQREAQYQQAFAVRYQGHPFIRVPAVFPQWCRPRVLVNEYVEGRGFDEMMAETTPEERRRYGEIVFRFVYGSLYRFRLFNADPHPGNYLFPTSGPDAGSVVFLDFGSVKLFGTQARDTLVETLRAAIDRDGPRLLDRLERAGFVPARAQIDTDRLVEWFEAIHAPILEDAEWTYTPDYAREVIRTTTDLRAGYIDTLRRLNLPAEYALLHRIQVGVNSILGRLRAQANWQRILREMWEGHPPSTELGAAERPFIDASPYLT